MLNGSSHKAFLSLMHSALHEEIDQFCKQIAAGNLATKPYISWAVKRFTRCLQVLWPRSRANLFGSNATGLALPTTDVDLVVSLPPVRNLLSDLEKAQLGLSPSGGVASDLLRLRIGAVDIGVGGWLYGNPRASSGRPSSMVFRSLSTLLPKGVVNHSFLQHEHHLGRPINQNLGSLLMDFLYLFWAFADAFAVLENGLLQFTAESNMPASAFSLLKKIIPSIDSNELAKRKKRTSDITSHTHWRVGLASAAL